MKCRKCGKTYNVNLASCPFCGYREEDMNMPSLSPVEEEQSDSSFGFLIPLIIIIIIGSIGYLVYNHFNEQNKEREFNSYLNDKTLEYKSKGYTFLDINVEDELDSFSLINEGFNYVSNNELNSPSSYCNIFEDSTIKVSISEGEVEIIDDSISYYKKVSNISNALFVTSYTKSGCECDEFKIVVLTSDGLLYMFESNGLNYTSPTALMDAMLIGFKEVKLEKLVRSVAVTSYVGDINPCGEKVLLIVFEDNEKKILRDGKLVDIDAPYSSIIYNVWDKESLYINTDRSISLGTTYDTNNELIKENGNIIKYIGAFKEKKANNIYILSKDNILYSVSYNNKYSIHGEGGMISNIGYKFDYHNNVTNYVFIFQDGTYKEYIGDFETHGVFGNK